MPGPWKHDTPCAISLTIDNLGEAADLNRHLWDPSTPLGNHYSVTEILPKFLALLAKYAIPATFFIEAWNLGVYPDAIRGIVDAGEGHEVAWHAWQHEAWGKECADEGVERGNFARSWGAMRKFIAEGENVQDGGGRSVEMYSGFRPPGGVIHGERTLRMCREFGLGYISPAAEHGAVVALPPPEDAGGSIVVLPFRWRTVDAYYYMPAFAKLREIKGELPPDPQPPATLVQAYKQQIDEAIRDGGFVSFLFHPFLTDSEERLQAMEEVLAFLAEKRDEGKVWLATCRQVEGFVRENPDKKLLGGDPGWDTTSWR